MRRTRPYRRNSLGGFSLVEVAMAMAIVGFAMISLIGLLPMGLSNFRQAMNNTVESQIVQSITNQIQLSSFNNLTTSTTPSYYDADGNLLTSAAGAVYTATTTVSSVQSPKYPVTLSNSAGAATADAITITIVNNTQAANQIATQTGQTHQTQTYTIIVANENN